MGKLTKIHIVYEIHNPPPLVYPKDELQGNIIVTNNGEKDLKLKELFIDLYEYYEKDGYEGMDTIKNKLSTFWLNTQGVIRADETQTYGFRIRLPRWKRRKGRKIHNWSIQLHFKQKTKLVASRGSIKRNATCILPVEFSQVAPSFGEWHQGKKNPGPDGPGSLNFNSVLLRRISRFHQSLR